MTDCLSLEHAICIEYINKSGQEQNLENWLKEQDRPIGLILCEGFEERSLAIGEKLAELRTKVDCVIIGRYSNHLEENKKYLARFAKLANDLAPSNTKIIDNDNDGVWVRKAIELSGANAVLLDITSISNRGLFGALDAASASNRQIFIGYSEPAQYWPKKADWDAINQNLSVNTSIAISELVDKAPWLFGYEHCVETVPGHEGYDSVGYGHALIGFLPFKAARLAAIIEREIYSEFIFIAGRPRLEENLWRLQALKRINIFTTKNWEIKEISTFSYRNAIEQIAALLFKNPSLLEKYDVHLAITGSKLQTIACWVVSSIVSSITVIASIPAVYYPESFSDGIGVSWVFELLSPRKLVS
ncbi:MAG: hypothetical protein K4571_02425 [Deltaproteobacteria bacterium]